MIFHVLSRLLSRKPAPRLPARRPPTFRPGLDPLEDRTLLNGLALTPGATRVDPDYGQLPLNFEVNQGQAAGAVDFVARGPGYGIQLAPEGATLSVRNPATGIGAAVRMDLVGANPAAVGRGLDLQETVSNYYTGSDPSRWLTGVANYGRVAYHDVYNGVDLVYYGNQRQLEYDFVVAPGADPHAIVVNFEGADGVDLDAQGHLVLHTAAGDLSNQAPRLYQDVGGVRTPVAGSYVLLGGNRVGFQVGAYDPSQPLVIDPVVNNFASFLGGTGAEDNVHIAANAAGEIYAVGSTTSTNFPVTPNGFQQTFAGGVESDAFITRFNATGTGLLYSTYFGGSGADDGRAITLDAANNVYIGGTTNSANFPVTPGAFQTLFGGTTDAFVAKFNAVGSLLYCTFIGGANAEQGLGIAVDAAGNALLTGSTNSLNNGTTNPANFPITTTSPTTVGALQLKYGGGTNDAFLLKLNIVGSALLYSSYLGGVGNDQANDIALDARGDVYLTGSTDSADFPLVNAFQTQLGGPTSTSPNVDAFVTAQRIPAVGTAASTLYSTFVGGSTTDRGNAIALDPASNAYVTGSTDSSGPSFGLSTGAVQSVNGGATDAFIVKVSAIDPNAPAAVSKTFATFLGGSGNDIANDIAVDPRGNAYVIGQTTSPNFPFPPNAGDALSTVYGGQNDFFISEVNSIGTRLLYSTYEGTTGNDIGTSLAISLAGNGSTANVFVGGQSSGFFPTTNGVFQSSFQGGFSDALLQKVVGFPVPTFHLTFVQQPTDTIVNAVINGATTPPGVIVQIFDENNQLVATDNSTMVTIQIGANPGGGTLSGTLTVKAVNGVATFPDLKIDKPGQGYTLLANDTNNLLIGATSTPFNILAPFQIQFGQQPYNVSVNTPMDAPTGPPVTVQILDANGQLITSDNTDQVTLTIGSGPSTATFNGQTQLTVTAQGGIATFSGPNAVQLDTPGDYTLVASLVAVPGSPAVPNVVSIPFTVFGGPVVQGTQLAFAQQPTNTAVGGVITPPVTVSILDDNNNVVTTDNSTQVTLALGNNPGGATLGGTLTVTAVNGVATFNDLTVSQPGTGYTLVASAPTLNGATSNPFDVLQPQPPTQLVYTQQPTTTALGAVIRPPVTLALVDNNGLVATTDNTSTVTVTLGNNPTGATLTGTTTVTVVNGVATFTDLAVSLPGTGYTLLATTNNPGILNQPVPSGPFDVTTTQPVTGLSIQAPGTSNGCAPFQLTVTALLNGVQNPGYTGAVHFTSSDPLAALPADYTFQAGDAGAHTFVVALFTPGLQTITVTDVGNPALTGTVTISVGAAGTNFNLIATGADAGGGPSVKVFDAVTKAVLMDFFPYDPAFLGGVRVAVGDVNDDGAPDLITAPGPGGGPDIKVFDIHTGTLIRQFFAFDPAFVGGLYVAVGDVNGDGFDDIVTGADAFGGPNVAVFDGKTTSDGSPITQLYNYFPFDQAFAGGVRVAVGDVNGDGFADLITGAGPGGGPNVSVINGLTGGLILSFFPFDPRFSGGVYLGTVSPVAGGCGPTDIVVGAGAGGGPNVVVVDGQTGQAILNFMAEQFGNFINFPDRFIGATGVRVSSADVNGDGFPDILTSFGPGHTPSVYAFDAASAVKLDSFFALNPLFQGGLFVGNNG